MGTKQIAHELKAYTYAHKAFESKVDIKLSAHLIALTGRPEHGYLQKEGGIIKSDVELEDAYEPSGAVFVSLDATEETIRNGEAFSKSFRAEVQGYIRDHQLGLMRSVQAGAKATERAKEVADQMAANAPVFGQVAKVASTEVPTFSYSEWVKISALVKTAMKGHVSSTTAETVKASGITVQTKDDRHISFPEIPGSTPTGFHFLRVINKRYVIAGEGKWPINGLSTTEDVLKSYASAFYSNIQRPKGHSETVGGRLASSGIAESIKTYGLLDSAFPLICGMAYLFLCSEPRNETAVDIMQKIALMNLHVCNPPAQLYQIDIPKDVVTRMGANAAEMVMRRKMAESQIPAESIQILLATRSGSVPDHEQERIKRIALIQMLLDKVPKSTAMSTSSNFEAAAESLITAVAPYLDLANAEELNTLCVLLLCAAAVDAWGAVYKWPQPICQVLVLSGYIPQWVIGCIIKLMDGSQSRMKFSRQQTAFSAAMGFGPRRNMTPADGKNKKNALEGKAPQIGSVTSKLGKNQSEADAKASHKEATSQVAEGE